MLLSSPTPKSKFEISNLEFKGIEVRELVWCFGLVRFQNKHVKLFLCGKLFLDRKIFSNKQKSRRSKNNFVSDQQSIHV